MHPQAPGETALEGIRPWCPGERLGAQRERHVPLHPALHRHTDPSVGVHAPHPPVLRHLLSCRAYYKEGLNPVRIYVENEDVRAVKGGTGYTKCGNIAASIRASARPRSRGYARVLWLDSAHPTKYIQEGLHDVMFKGRQVITLSSPARSCPASPAAPCLELLRDWGITVHSG